MNRAKTSVPDRKLVEAPAVDQKNSSKSLRLAYSRKETEESLVRAGHYVARTNTTKKSKTDLSMATIGSRTKITVIENSDAALRLLDILERVSNEQANRSGSS